MPQHALPSNHPSPHCCYRCRACAQVSIAGRRLDTGELIQPEVIHLHDFTSHSGGGTGEGKLLWGPLFGLLVVVCRAHVPHNAQAALSQQLPVTCCLLLPARLNAAAGTSDLPPIPACPSAPHTPAAAASSSTASHTIQETARTPEQVYLTHGTVAAAAAAAGGLVGGAPHLGVRTAANVAEAAVDPAAVVDFDCASPAASSSAATQQTGGDGGSGLADAAGEVQQGPSGLNAGGRAVLPEDREEVCTTLQRLRSAGQIQGPDTPTVASSTPAQAAPSTVDAFLGAAVADAAAPASSKPTAAAAAGASSLASSFTAAAAGPAGQMHPSAPGVSASTAAPAQAGDPDPSSGTAEPTPAAAASPQAAASGSDSSGMWAAHDAAAWAAAVAGALTHVGVDIHNTAALADTATQPAQAVEAAAAESGSAAGPAATTPRASSLHQQHTLAEFLLDESATAAMAAHSTAQHSSASSSAGATAASSAYQVDLSAGTSSVAAEDDMQVQLDIGRSTRLLSADGSVAAAAATVPAEAVAAIRSSSDAAEAPKSPRHPSLLQLSMFHQPASGSSSSGGAGSSMQQDKPSAGLPYGLTVADIVAATVASEERRFRVVSPRSSAGDNFFTASSGPSTPRDAGPAVERSTSPLSASATRAIFDSVQLAVQQQQEVDQLALVVARSASLSRGGGGQHAGTAAAAGAAADSEAEASTAARMASGGSGDSTATSSRSSSAAGSARDEPVQGLHSQAEAGHAAATAAGVAQQNAEVMQGMLQEAAMASSAHAAAAPIAAAGPPAGTRSTDSTASQCGDDSDQDAAADMLASVEGSTSPSAAASSAGDRLAAAVAAESADPVAAAASGADVAATAAPAFPSVMFGAGAMDLPPVDLPAVSRGRDSAGLEAAAGPSSAGQGAAASEDLSAAASLPSAGLASLSTGGSNMHEPASPAPPAAEDRAVRRVVDATSAAVVSSAGMDAPPVAAASAAAAATELHAEASDPAAAAASAAQLVVDAANTVPGMLEPSDVASAAAAAGAAAAAAVTPGMDPASAAVACAAAAAAPMANPDDVAAAAASAVAGMQAGAAAQAPPASQRGLAGAAATSTEQNSKVNGFAEAGGDLAGLLPILAPAGTVGDEIVVSSSSSGASLQGPAMSAQLLQTVPEAAALEGNGGSSSLGRMSAQAGVAQSGSTRRVEELNREGLAAMYDPLIIQLALASSAPLEGLGLEESNLAGMDAAAAIAASGRALTDSSSFGTAATSGGPGMLLLQPHPLACVAAIKASAGPEKHLAAAEEALAQLDSDSKLQRQRTDSISLGGRRSSALDEATALAAAAAEAPAGPAAE